MRKSTLVKLSGSMGLALALSACGSSNGSTTPAPTTPPAAASFESMFGSAFAALFDASPTSVATDPPATSIPALAPASPPIAG